MVELRRLFDPRSIAVVGASEREHSYGGETLLNLRRLGFGGQVWPVNPRRETVHGLRCHPSLADTPEPPDAVVVAVPAAAVPEVIEEAGALGCGGAVVYGAGFAEIAAGRSLQEDLVAAARRHDLPVCGPNGNGIVAFGRGLALWGDALTRSEPGPVALVSQSGNQAVNALTSKRGLRFHTVVSSGNQAVLEAADYLDFLATEEGVRSVALNLETDGDGARLCAALAACADAGIGVAILKVGSSAAGAAAAAAHTGAVAGDQRVFRALVEEAGAAWAEDPHELLELAKTLALRKARDLRADRAVTAGTTETETPGLAVLTCSGGDSSAAGDAADRLSIRFPPLAEKTERRLRELLPSAATVGNPLDYTSMIWGERERLRELMTTVADDPAVGRLLIFYDEPAGLEGDSKISWETVREGILDGGRATSVPVLVASTLPELLQDSSAKRMGESGVPAIAGLRTGIICAEALAAEPGDPARLREIASVARRAGRGNGVGRWMPEHEAKALLREAGIEVVPGRVADDADDAASLLAELGPPVVAKLSDEGLLHKTEIGAVALDLRTESDVRAAHGRLLSLREGRVLVERMAPSGAELLVAARRDGVVPSLAVGLGGIWTESLGDAAVIPLPASADRVERALRDLRGAALLTGGRGRPALDLAAASRLGAAAGELVVEAGLDLVELNPIFVYERGAVVVDALARE